MTIKKVKLDRTLCAGFGICARHAPEYFSLDDWGYAALEGEGTVSELDQAGVVQALLDCPVHAIVSLDTRSVGQATSTRRTVSRSTAPAGPVGESDSDRTLGS